MDKALILSDTLEGWIRGVPKWRNLVRTKSASGRVFVAFTEKCPTSVREEILALADKMKVVLEENGEFRKVAISVKPMSRVTGEINLWDPKDRVKKLKAGLALYRKRCKLMGNPK